MFISSWFQFRGITETRLEKESRNVWNIISCSFPCSDCGDLLDHFDEEEEKVTSGRDQQGSQQGLNQLGQRLKNRFRNHLRPSQKQKLVQLQTFDNNREDEEDEFEV